MMNEQWNSLKHGGILIAPTQLSSLFSHKVEISPYHERVLRFSLTNFSHDQKETLGSLLNVILEEILELKNWKKGNNVPKNFEVKSIVGDNIKPRRVWQDGKQNILPLFVPKDLNVRLGIGRGKRSVSRVIEWLRKTQNSIAILTNGKEWRLIHAGVDHDAWAQWDTDLWFQEGKMAPQVFALKALLGYTSVKCHQNNTSLLLTAIKESKAGQTNFSQVLGERVRQAVELLIQSNQQLNTQNTEVQPSHLYIASIRIVMRLIVILFAEARDLLPRNNMIYHESYGLQGLREQLQRIANTRGERQLLLQKSSWSRLLALFRLISEGSHHEAMPIPSYGGSLFQQGDLQSQDPILRALTFFESIEAGPNDSVIYKILELICKNKVNVRQGNKNIWVETPINFSDLSSEYIGILYEGLLDFELKQADETMVFLNVGEQPVLPLSRLQDMNSKQIKSLFKEFSSSKTKTSEAEEVKFFDFEQQELEEQQKVHHWAKMAVRAAGMVKEKDGEEKQVEAAQKIVIRTILRGEWYLVRWGGTRKGSGSFYTPPLLAIPTVHKTLTPLVCNEIGAPRKPEEILALKVCDPAMGSGSFLLAALRFLTEALFESLYFHNRIEKQEKYVVTLAKGEDSKGNIEEQLLPDRPDTPEFEERLKSVLKRYVVEHCLYGVDLDDLAVELGRLALWIETMDRELPFEFLDHKIKVGNSLVGCWLDRFAHYPIASWQREAADKTHSNGVHYGKNIGNKVLREKLKKEVKPALHLIIEQGTEQLTFFKEKNTDVETVHSDLRRLVRRLQKLGTSAKGIRLREEMYRNDILNNDSFQLLKERFNIWCALWFWPIDQLDCIPMPDDFWELPEKSQVIARQLAKKYCFFHWELEFPDVFHRSQIQDSSSNDYNGFDAIIGNPPWEIQKPVSKEFFSNIDPLYRTYGKQEAIQKQRQMFEENRNVEQEWLYYNDYFKSFSNWTKYNESPFGEKEHKRINLASSGAKWRQSDELHTKWELQRKKRKSFVVQKPFSYQGGGDINTYKLFLEMSYILLRKDGWLGMITPSGIYTDQGTKDLRILFLEKSNWQWLFGFENRKKVFDIDSRFKFCALVVEKGRVTKGTKVAFMKKDLEHWENSEQYAVFYPFEQVSKFSPNSYAFLEISEKTELSILKKIFKNSTSIASGTWPINYSTEFHMSGDSKYFFSRSKIEKEGFAQDIYGQWVKGKNLPLENAKDIQNKRISTSKQSFVKCSAIEEIAVPLYQGAMINILDYSSSHYITGGGHRAYWSQNKNRDMRIFPQFLIKEKDLELSVKYNNTPKIAYRRIARATDTRTMISTVLNRFGAGDSLFFFLPQDKKLSTALSVAGFFSSLTFDYQLRIRLGGTNLSEFVMIDCTLPCKLSGKVKKLFNLAVAKLCFPSQIWAPEWIKIKQEQKITTKWQSLWALTKHERLRNQCVIDAITAKLYGLEYEDLKSILHDCNYSVDQLKNNEFTGKLNPKGFWRIDKDQPPELRHTNLTLLAFKRLKEMGIENFCTEDWQFPPEIALRLGPRYLDWQLEETPEESWKECEQHAKNILGEERFSKLFTEKTYDEAYQDYSMVAEETPRYNAAPEESDNQMNFFEDED